MTTTIEDLPEEVLLKLFTYLHHNDIKSLREVNSTIRDLTRIQKFTEKDKIVIKNEPITREEFNFESFAIELNVDGEPSELLRHSNFLRERGKNVKSLHLKYSTKIFANVWEHILQYVPYLEDLAIQYEISSIGRAPVFETPENFSFSKMRHLKITYRSGTWDHLLSILGLKMGLLESFSFHFIDSGDEPDCAGEVVFYPPHALLGLLENSKHTLKSFSLVDYDYIFDNHPTFYRQCLNAIGPQLLKLSLPRIDLDDKLVEYISHQFPNLNDLEFKDCLSLSEVCKKMPKFRNFTLNYKSANYQYYCYTEGLRDLSWVECELYKFREWNSYSNLTSLCAAFNVSNDVFEKLVSQVPNLTDLYLRCEKKLLDNDTLKIIGEHCTQVRYLHIENSSGLTDVEPLNNLKGLLELTLVHCNHLGDEGVSNLSLPELRKLSFGRTHVTELGIQKIRQQCPALRYCVSGMYKMEVMWSVSKLYVDDSVSR